MIAGLAAAAMHGAQWIDDDVPDRTDLDERSAAAWSRDSRRQTAAGEEGGRRRIRHDTGPHCVRHRPIAPVTIAVARLDALGTSTRFNRQQMCELIAGGAASTPGLPHFVAALDLYDAGAESPKETRLRLLLIRAGFPAAAHADSGPRPTSATARISSIWAGTTCWSRRIRRGPALRTLRRIAKTSFVPNIYAVGLGHGSSRRRTPTRRFVNRMSVHGRHGASLICANRLISSRNCDRRRSSPPS